MTYNLNSDILMITNKAFPLSLLPSSGDFWKQVPVLLRLYYGWSIIPMQTVLVNDVYLQNNLDI